MAPPLCRNALALAALYLVLNLGSAVDAQPSNLFESFGTLIPVYGSPPPSRPPNVVFTSPAPPPMTSAPSAPPPSPAYHPMAPPPLPPRPQAPSTSPSPSHTAPPSPLPAVYPLVPSAAPPSPPLPPTTPVYPGDQPMSPPHSPPSPGYAMSYPPPPLPSPPPPPPNPPRPPAPPSDPCGDCSYCMATLAPVVRLANASRVPSNNAAVTARLFMDSCRGLPSAYTAYCGMVAVAILSGTSFIGGRAGMMCTQLGACKPQLTCPPYIAPKLNAPSDVTLTGSLDRCTAEGVTGGQLVQLPTTANTSSPTACRTRATCGPGYVCYMGEDEGRAPYQVCSCTDGRDTCYEQGDCTPYCDLKSTKRMVQRLNAGSSTCTPDPNNPKSRGLGGKLCDVDERCVTVAGCQDWSCNNVTQSLVSSSCDGKCLPLVLRATSARLWSSGAGVSASLNSYAARLFNAPCDTVFDAETVKLLGTGAQCSVYDDSLSVRLPATATIKPGQPLVFPASGSTLVAQLKPSESFTESVTVLNCWGCARPHGVIVGPSALRKPCSGDKLVNAAGAVPPAFDGSLSSHPSGRAAWTNVMWAVNEAASAGTAEGRALLKAAVDRTNALTDPNDRLTLKLTMSESNDMPGGQDYMVLLTLTSWLGTTSTTAFTFSKAGDNSPPSIKVVGATRQEFSLAGGLRAEADAGQVCGGKAVNWQWDAPDGWLGMPDGGIQKQQVYFPSPVLAAHGQEIKLRVQGTFKGATNSAADEVTLVAVGSPPQPKLKGPNGKVAKAGNLVFNATSSRDPDTIADLQQLTYKWECRREDFPTPCFKGSVQGDMESVPGVWTLPASLLVTGIKYTITVTVNKVVPSGTSALASSTYVDFRLADPADFPTGSLTRLCTASQCGGPHNTAEDLAVALTLDAKFSSGTSVSWSSADIPLDSSLVAVQRPAGTFTLTIPSSKLPTQVNSTTIVVLMSRGGLDGMASLTVNLNAPPACTLNSTRAAACFKVDMAESKYPQAVATISAAGWSDYLDGTALTYEFGITDGNTVNVQQVGSTPSAVLLGLNPGTRTLYGCAIDSNGARACGTLTREVVKPDASFNAGDTLKGVDVDDVGKSNDKKKLFQAANQCAAVNRALKPGGGAHHRRVGRMLLADTTVSTQTIGLVNSVMAGTNLLDIDAVKLALSSITNTASSASGLLTIEASNVVLSALDKLATALSGSSGGVSTASAQQICSILAASLPSPLTPDGSKAWLNTMLTSTASIAAGLGRQATPGSYLATGADIVWVSAGAVSLAGDSFASATAKSGPNAGSSAGRRSVLELLQNQDQIQNQNQQQQQHSGPFGRTLHMLDAPRHNTVAEVEAAMDPATAAADVSAGARRTLLATTSIAEASLTLSGSGATAASSFTVGATHVLGSTATGVVVSALGTGLPTSVTLVSGLVDVNWGTVTPGAANTPPSLDGTSSFILVQLPSTSAYDTGKLTACLQYIKSTNTITGPLAGLTASTSTATFVERNTTTGLVTCRVTAAGTYIVGQSPPPVIQVAVPQQAKKSKSIVGAVVGGVIGGIAALAIIVLIILLVHRRRKQQHIAVATGPSSAAVPASRAVSGPEATEMEIVSLPPGGGMAPGGGGGAAAGAAPRRAASGGSLNGGGDDAGDKEKLRDIKAGGGGPQDFRLPHTPGAADTRTQALS